MQGPARRLRTRAEGAEPAAQAAALVAAEHRTSRERVRELVVAGRADVAAVMEATGVSKGPSL